MQNKNTDKLYEKAAANQSLCFHYMDCKDPRLYEPRREKTGLPGFRQGPTQTGLYILRRKLDA